jgi:hypothetical protein
MNSPCPLPFDRRQGTSSDQTKEELQKIGDCHFIVTGKAMDVYHYRIGDTPVAISPGDLVIVPEVVVVVER